MGICGTVYCEEDTLIVTDVMMGVLCFGDRRTISVVRIIAVLNTNDECRRAGRNNNLEAS
jgi:bifunctional ADP-heptose synthase (sugar kinase/adenylyltransferase)